MPFGDQTQSAKLAHHRGASGLGFQGGRAGIAMAIDNIARVRIDPTAGVIDQSRWVQRLETLGQTLRVILSPALIEKNPEDDGGMVVLVFYHVEQLNLEFTLSFRGGVVAAGHVLPDQQPEFVAPIIPSIRLNLDVLSSQVETGAFEKGNVGAQSIISGSGVDAVRPEALVQSADLE